jgi:hypothetical protein
VWERGVAGGAYNNELQRSIIWAQRPIDH